MKKNPKQHASLASAPAHASVVTSFRVKLAGKFAVVRKSHPSNLILVT
jgi:hypothetical protein